MFMRESVSFILWSICMRTYIGEKFSALPTDFPKAEQTLKFFKLASWSDLDLFSVSSPLSLYNI